MKANQDLRDLAKNCGVHFWQVAMKMQCSESVVSRMLRVELDQSQKDEIHRIIDEIAREKASVTC